jgi:hypothetical protein
MKALHRVFGIAGLIILGSCKHAEPPVEQSQLPQFRVEVFSRELVECEERLGYCARFHVEYPVFEANLDSVVCKTVNTAIINAIANQVTEKEAQGAVGPSLESAAKHFFELYYADNDKSAYYSAWEWTTSSEVLFLSREILSLSIENNNYTGGAHPNMYAIFLNFDLNTGKKIRLKDLVKDMKALEKLARDAFYRAKGFSDEEVSVMVADRQINFAFPENFGITTEGLYFFYNTYEAGSYAEGPVDFVLSWKILEGIVKDIMH